MCRIFVVERRLPTWGWEEAALSVVFRCGDGQAVRLVDKATNYVTMVLVMAGLGSGVIH